MSVRRAVRPGIRRPGGLPRPRLALPLTAALAAALALTAPAPYAAAAAAPRHPVSGALDRPGDLVRPRGDTPELPSRLSALSWLVVDADSGQVLAARNAHRRLPPASTLKTLFAVTAIPRLPSAEWYEVTEADLAGIGEGSSLVGLVPGRSYRVADLWRGVFLSSGGDAVRVLAGMNGGWEESARQMQETAAALGARDTRVLSPDGYDTPGQVSSAYDLAVFGRAGLRDPEFAGYCATVTAEFPGGDGGSYQIQNTDRLLSGARGVRPYPGLIGVKNGYTTEAGNTLIAAARRDGHTALVTVMNPQSGVYNAVYDEARSLLDWGLAAAGHTVPLAELPPVPAALPSPPGVTEPGAPPHGAAGPPGHRAKAVAAAAHRTASAPPGAGRQDWFPAARAAAGGVLLGACALMWLRHRARRAAR